MKMHATAIAGPKGDTEVEYARPVGSHELRSTADEEER